MKPNGTAEHDCGNDNRYLATPGCGRRRYVIVVCIVYPNGNRQTSC